MTAALPRRAAPNALRRRSSRLFPSGRVPAFPFPRNPYRGTFIALEGIDGSAKTTQAKRLVRVLRRRGLTASYTREPWWGGRETASERELLGILEGKIAAGSDRLQALMVRNRERHLLGEVIAKLKRSARAVVVTDRYVLSTFAYAAATTSLTFEAIVALHRREAPHTFAPDCTIVLDVSVDEALRRLRRSGRPSAHIFEERETLRKVRRAYRQLAEAFRDAGVALVDGRGTEEEVLERLLPLVEAAIARNVRADGA